MWVKTSMSLSERFFGYIVKRPVIFIVTGLMMCCGAGLFLPSLEKDVRSDAFLAADNSALIYRDIVKEQFGLSDPLVVAVVSEADHGIYSPATLEFVRALTEEIDGLSNIDTTRTVSLATENNIRSTQDGMDIVPFLDPFPQSIQQAQSVREQVEAFPLYRGNLVSRDGKATLLIVEMLDEGLAEPTYHEVIRILNESSVPDDVRVHVAGEGAVVGYLGSYVDADAQKLVPLAGLVITLTIFFAYGSLSPALMCIVIMMATIVITLGAMAAQSVPFYVITSALPVILIGISVADAIHIYSHFFDLQRESPRRSVEDLVVATMASMWRPITLTTLTTIAGFMGLYFAAYMPPFRYFGLYAAFGVGIAWFFSMSFLPAAMVLTKPRFYQRKSQNNGKALRSTRVLSALGIRTQQYSSAIIMVFLLVVVFGVVSAMNLTVDDDPIAIFHPDEPISIADRVINQYTTGSNTLDIVIETNRSEALFDPDKLKKIEALQAYATKLPNVGGSVSIVDYLKQMNRALNEGRPEAYQLPNSRDSIAQYFLIYSALSDPADFEEEIDYDYRLANVRVNLTSGGHQDIKPVILSLERYIAEEFNSSEMTATLSGRVNLNYHWIKELSSSHFAGMVIALVLVWGVATLLFRSELAGLYTLIPVAGSVLGVYSIMVLWGVTLGLGTSMFAAIAIGLGIDFAIHTLDRMRTLCSDHNGDLDAAFREFYPSTGRALLINFAAIACGFAVLLMSNIMSLVNFGGIVMLSIGISFIASMTILPAVVWKLRPGFVVAPPAGYSIGTTIRNVLFVVIITFIASVSVASAEEQLSADEVVQLVNAVDQGEQVTRKLSMTLIDRHSKERHRETITYRKYYGQEMRTVLFYLSPTNVRNTAFLIWDYSELQKDDSQWLYLPAMRKVRRISAADRGDYFLGTDFTYEDIKLDGKLSPEDYTFTVLESDAVGEKPVYRLEGTPKTEKIASELGYSKIEMFVDASNWVVYEAHFWDLKNRPLKTLIVTEVEPIDGIWTRKRMSMKNHNNSHETRFEFTEVDYLTPVDDGLFTKRALERGI
jgi:predicted RND superfamily exporter protein